MYVLTVAFCGFLWPIVGVLALVTLAVGLPIFGMYRFGQYIRTEMFDKRGDANG